jgi:exopolysaccharide biosynthesis polyprenyl glycosylphosphotransferase
MMAAKVEIDAPHLSAPTMRRAGAVRWARRTLKEWAFGATFSLAASVIGVAAFALSFLAHVGVPICGHGICADGRPYIPVLMFAAVVRGLLFAVRRPFRSRRRGYVEDLAEAVREAGLGSLIIVMFAFFWRGGSRFRSFSYARGVFLLDWVIATVGLALLFWVMKKTLGALRTRGHNLRNVAIVGGSRTARSFMEDITAHPETGYRLVAAVDDDHVDNRRFVEELARLVEHREIDEVIFATSAIGRSDISSLLGVPAFRHVEVHALPELLGLPAAKASLVPAGDFPMLRLTNEPLPVTSRLVKRSMDVVLGMLALVVAGPFMAAAAVAVRLDSPGPVLFRQSRIGMDGRPFQMLKFRTMRHGADSVPHQEYVASLINGSGHSNGSGNGELYKLVDDRRVTRAGRLLRRFSLDELPQLLNVLWGDMSLVGPRPPLPYEVALYSEWHGRRLDVRPGMSGLWQVSGRSRLSYDDMVRLDLHYIDTWSLGRDLLILLKTVPALARGDAS